MAVIPQKIQILKFIAEQGVVTVDDINRGLFEDNKSSIIRVTLHQLKIAHAKFGNIKHGVWYIDKPELFDLLKTFFPNIPALEVKPLLLYQVPHNLEINRIRIALEKASHIAIDQWWSERFIRALQRRNLSLGELSKISGVQPATLSRMENNKAIGSLKNYMSIAKSLGLKLSELFAAMDK